MTGSWTQHARFDNRNRMMAAWADGSGAPADAYAFAYDANGERVLRYRVQDDGVHDATFYLRDEGGNVLTEYMWVPEQPGDTLGQWYRLWDWAYRGREPMARIARGGLYREYTSLVADHLESTRAEYGPDGLVKFDYAPFGEVANQPTGTTLETHLFTGHEREFLGTSPPGDALQGRDYMHARYYSNQLGRFLSVDPAQGEVGSSQSWNRYSYVQNNPLNLLDPTGEAAKAELLTTGQPDDPLLHAAIRIYDDANTSDSGTVYNNGGKANGILPTEEYLDRYDSSVDPTTAYPLDLDSSQVEQLQTNLEDKLSLTSENRVQYGELTNNCAQFATTEILAVAPPPGPVTASVIAFSHTAETPVVVTSQAVNTLVTFGLASPTTAYSLNLQQAQVPAQQRHGAN